MTQATQAGVRPNNIRVVLFGLMIAMMLAMLDNMIVSTALPRIVGEFGGLNHFTWVVTAYVLGTTVSTPIWGKLGDLYGRKSVFLTSVVVFLVGSALCGMAGSGMLGGPQDGMVQLIAFRAVQGLGAGGLMVGVMAIIGDLVPPRERGRYQGMIAGIMAIAMVAGPLAGGFITDHLSWRWAFYVNLPLGGIALLVLITTMHLPKYRTEHRIDWLGAGLLSVGITAIVLITTWGGNEYDWTSPQILGLAVLAVRRVGGVRPGGTPGPGADPAAGALRQPQLRADLGDRLPARLRDVRRDELPAALPADRAGGVGDQQRSAAAAADVRHAGGLAGHRPGDHPQRQVPGVPDHRWCR